MVELTKKGKKLDGKTDFHPFFVTHTGILTSNRSNTPHGISSSQLERSPTIISKLTIRNFGTMLSPGTSSAQCHSTSELLRTL